MLYTLLTRFQEADDGSAWEALVSALPTDPASVFVVILLLACVGSVVWFGRSSGGTKPDSSDSD